MKRTRTELLQTRLALGMARRGAEILSRKRDALLVEMLRTAREALEFRRNVGALAAEAANALIAARGHEGDEQLKSLGLAARREVLAEVQVHNVWGLHVPTVVAPAVGRRPGDRGYGLLGTSPAVDEAAGAFEQLVSFALVHGPREVRLRRLAAEIRRTTRKVNTLEHRLIPRLEREVRATEAALEEQEREDQFRLQIMEEEGGRSH